MDAILTPISGTMNMSLKSSKKRLRVLVKPTASVAVTVDLRFTRKVSRMLICRRLHAGKRIRRNSDGMFAVRNHHSSSKDPIL